STSTRLASSRSRRYESFCTAWMASRCVLFIFQLAAMTGRRASSLAAAAISAFLHQDLDAGERPALQELERGPAPRREMVDAVEEIELLQGGEAVPAADHRIALRQGDRLGHARVPAENGSSSNTPMGPFQKMVVASAMVRANSS